MDIEPDISHLPFYDLSNAELSDLYINLSQKKTLTELNELVYDNFNNAIDTSSADTDPNVFLKDSFGFKNPQCSYIFPGKLDCLQIHNNSLSLMNYNIGSIPANLESFIDECLTPLQFNFDILGFCETKLTKNLENLYSLEQYNSFYNHHTRHKGGVALYVNKDLESTLRPDITVQFDYIETIFVEISMKPKNLIIGQIYRRPKSNMKMFFDKFKEILDKISLENKTCILSGDFNLNLLKLNDKDVLNLIATLNSKFYFSSITKPTRVTNTSATLIDHIWTNNFSSVQKSTIIYDNTSDHFPACTLFNYDFKKEPNKKTTIEYRDFSEANISRFRNHLAEICWDNVYATRDTNIAMDNFNTIFNASFDKFFPVITKQVKIKSLEKPYITQDIKILIAEKNKLQKKYAKWPLSYGPEYRRLRNKVTKAIREAKSNYYANKFETEANNSQKTWKTINNILKRGNTKKTNLLSKDEIKITNPSDIANEFNHYFTTIADKLAESLPQTNMHFNHFLGNRVEENFNFNDISDTEIKNAVSSLNNSAPGYDNIPISLIKSIFSDIISPVKHICNCSLRSGIFPQSMKIAKVFPLHKSGNVCTVSNFRPVSVLSAISKILERIVYNRLITYLEDRNIITEAQYGFRKNKSTESAVINLTNEIYSAFDRNEFTLTVSIDLSKAFDTVNHSILMGKLNHYGIRDKANSWFKSYLEDRQQFVLFNKTSSKKGYLKHGVPQGSILGPLLFLIYINDLASINSFFKYTMYADDCCIYVSGPDINELIRRANEELIMINSWINCNKLTLNSDKTHFLI